MPVVPFSAAAGGSKPKHREVSADEEPWVLMAAAQMDQQKRLIEPEPQEPSDGSTNGG